MRDTPRAILERARLRIFEPKHWTGDFRALTARGVACESQSPDAVRWNAVGAIKAEAGYCREYFQAIAFLCRAASELFKADTLDALSRIGHAPTLLTYGRAMEMAVEAEPSSSVGVAGPASGPDHVADQVFGLDQRGRAPDVRPGADEADRAHAQAFLHFLEYVSPELRLPLAERSGQIVKQGREHEVRDALSLRDHYVVWLHERYSRMAAGENVDDAAPASSPPPATPSPTLAQRVAADGALKRAHRLAARLTEQQHLRHADTADNALLLMLATMAAADAFAQAAEATKALVARWECA